MSDFDIALAFSLKWEGGDKITNDPDDPGGLTKYGISKRANPDLDIENLTYAQASSVYKSRYWTAGGCDFLPKPLNVVQFDACVNHGVSNATKFIQRAANTNDDGVIGPLTMKAINEFDPNLLSISAIEERNRFYDKIVENNPVQNKYLVGWKNRTKDLEKFIKEML